MIKTKLPVIVLRNVILLPQGEIKLEVHGMQDKDVIYRALNNHSGYVLLSSPKYATEFDIPKEDLPKTKNVEPLPESERPRKDGPGGN